MQKQIKVNDIYCLLKGSYDGTFEKLKTVDDIFTSRNVRGNLLVWDLPDDGWTPLSNADSVMSAMVKGEISKRKQSAINTFGSDKAAYVEKCYTVPDDGCIFFKTDEKTGILKIRLAAWGYSYPTRPNGGVMIGGGNFKGKEKEIADLNFSYNGEPLRNKQFSILRPDGGSNTFTTDSNGNFNFLGQPLNVGEPIKIVVDGKQITVTIEKGKNDYPIDLTKSATVSVKVFLDGSPKQGAEISTANIKTETDESGTAKFEIVVPQNGSLTVFVKGENTNGSDTKTITEGENFFTFDFSSPKVEPPVIEPPTVDKEEKKQEEEPSSQKEELPLQEDESETMYEPVKDDEQVYEETKLQDPQQDHVINIGPQQPQEPVVSTDGGSVWPKIFIILGLIILILGAYYAGYKILN